MNTQKKPLKIAIVAYDLQPGGLSKVIVEVFKMLQSEYTVKLLLFNNTEILHESIPNVKVQIKDSLISRFNKYLRLKQILKENKFDFILDFRYRINPLTEFFWTKFIYSGNQVIYTIHSSRLETYLPKSTFLTQFFYGDSFKIVCVSKGIEQSAREKFDLKNLVTIYNSISIENKTETETEFNFIENQYILAIGRFEKVKQFDKLIVAYSQSKLPSKNIKLVIVGNGTQFEACQNLVRELHLDESVQLTGYLENTKELYQNALLTVLCSKHEGFPMVILESLAAGVPVVSFDLETGPSEIILDKNNGLLVENQNFDKLIEAIETLVSNEELYKFCQSNTVVSVEKFKTENIKNDWFVLLNSLINDK